MSAVVEPGARSCQPSSVWGDRGARFFLALGYPPEKCRLGIAFGRRRSDAGGITCLNLVLDASISFSVISAKTALARGAWTDAGETQTNIVAIQDSDPTDKRKGVFYDKEVNRLRTLSLEVPDDEIISIPYDKRYGMDDPFSLESRESFGITPDGTVGDQVKEIARFLTGEE